MNTVIDTLLSHRSIRKFTDKPLTPAQIDTISKAAVAGSTSSFIQCTSIIRVTDIEKRQKLAEYAGNQAYVVGAAEFWVFCMDFHRHQQISPDAKLGFAEQTLIGAVDTAICGQNTLLAAESLGLGGVFIGAIRNNPLAVIELLNIPDNVMPLFGMCLGYPAQNPEIKPRLPQSIFFHHNGYQKNIDNTVLDDYDSHVKTYYQTRTNNKKSDTWSEQITAILAKETRPFMKEALNKQGFCLK